MQTSDDGIKLIQKYEGLSLRAYKCPAGIWTIGYGHTNNVRPDDVITKEQALKLLLIDLKLVECAIIRNVKKPLNQAQFDALASFIFNVGAVAFHRSTLLKKLNLEDYIGASNEFGKWVYANKKKLKGLVDRRAAEKQLFLKQ